MSEIDDGVIKYERHFTPSPALKPDQYSALENWRKKLFQLKLIGEYPDVFIGYGNLSQKIDGLDRLEFIITATQTGKYKDLNGEHYTIVENYDLERNAIYAKGCMDASSEALTHAAIYECSNEINVVFHIHDNFLWKTMIENDYDHTSRDIPYGTVEMAKAMKTIVNGKSSGLFAMAGHLDGIVAWGNSLDEAGELILSLVEKFKP